MRSRRTAKLSASQKPSNALTQVLEKSENVKGIIEECADELSSVNVELKVGLQDRDELPGVENALAKSEAVEKKVQEASEKLSLVNLALTEETDERHLLEVQLASTEKQRDEARHASLHDPLTGLPNRALFNDRLEHGLAQAKRHGASFAVIFLDLNDFKKINDTHGHDVGDVVLKTIAGRLKEITRDDDTVCRHGGDEFLYILTEIQKEGDIAKIAEKIIKAVQVPCDIRIRELDFSLSISPSIGISIFPNNGTEADTLLESADKAMYRAKRDKTGYSFAGNESETPA